MRTLFIVAILGYRAIPRCIRSLWSFGTSNSHLALEDLRAGRSALAAARNYLAFNPSMAAWPGRDGFPIPD